MMASAIQSLKELKEISGQLRPGEKVKYIDQNAVLHNLVVHEVPVLSKSGSINSAGSVPTYIIELGSKADLYGKIDFNGIVMLLGKNAQFSIENASMKDCVLDAYEEGAKVSVGCGGAGGITSIHYSVIEFRDERSKIIPLSLYGEGNAQRIIGNSIRDTAMSGDMAITLFSDSSVLSSRHLMRIRRK